MPASLRGAANRINQCSAYTNVTIGSLTLRRAYRATEVLDAVESFLSSRNIIHDTLTRRQHAKAVCRDLVDLKIIKVLYPQRQQ